MCGIWQSALQLQSMAPTGTRPQTGLCCHGNYWTCDNIILRSYDYKVESKELHVALTMHCPGECYRSTGNMTIIDMVIMHMCNLNKIFRDVLFPLIMTEHLVKTLASFYHHKDKHILCRNATLTYNSWSFRGSSNMHSICCGLCQSVWLH